jgi:hypothetical protein
MMAEIIKTPINNGDGYALGIENSSRDDVWKRLQIVLPDMFGNEVDNNLKEIFEKLEKLMFSDRRRWFHGDLLSVEANGVVFGEPSMCILRIFDLPTKQGRERNVTMGFGRIGMHLCWILPNTQGRSTHAYLNFIDVCDFKFAPESVKIKSNPSKPGYVHEYRLQEGIVSAIDLGFKHKSRPGISIDVKRVKSLGNNLLGFEWSGLPSGGDRILTLPISISANI